eukprot:2535905-Amphidinium_carterae.1
MAGQSLETKYCAGVLLSQLYSDWCRTPGTCVAECSSDLSHLTSGGHGGRCVLLGFEPGDGYVYYGLMAAAKMARKFVAEAVVKQTTSGKPHCAVKRFVVGV